MSFYRRWKQRSEEREQFIDQQFIQINTSLSQYGLAISKLQIPTAGESDLRSLKQRMETLENQMREFRTQFNYGPWKGQEERIVRLEARVGNLERALPKPRKGKQ